jgi:hypothetical protein
VSLASLAACVGCRPAGDRGSQDVGLAADLDSARAIESGELAGRRAVVLSRRGGSVVPCDRRTARSHGRIRARLRPDFRGDPDMIRRLAAPSLLAVASTARAQNGAWTKVDEGSGVTTLIDAAHVTRGELRHRRDAP